MRTIVGISAGVALAALAWHIGQEQGAKVDAEAVFGSMDAETARSGLRVQPLSSSALRDLAIADDRDISSSSELLALANKVSRRDAATQILLLEAGVQEGDTRRALSHYDAVLSTSPAQQTKLLEILAKASIDPEIIQEVMRYADRPWFVSLVAIAARTPDSTDVALNLATRANMFRNPETRDWLVPHLIQALAQTGRHDQARRIAGSMGAAGWETLGFSAASVDTRLGTFAWQIVLSPSLRAEWRAPGTFAVSIEPGRRVPVASRTTSFAPGSYRLSFRVEAPSPPGAAIQWVVKCSDPTGTEIGSYSVPAPSARASVDRLLTIPVSCPYQNWLLLAEAVDAQMPSQTLVSELKLVLQ